MKNTKVHLKKKDAVIKILFAIYEYFYFLLSLSSLNKNNISILMIRVVSISVIIILLGNYLFTEKVKLKELLLIFLYILLILFIEIKLKNVELLVCVVFMICTRKTDFISLVKLDFVLKIFNVLNIFILCKMGFLSNISGYYNGNYKNSFGFMHPNTFGTLWLAILIEFLFLKYEKLKIQDYLFCGILWFICMILTNSRTSGYSFLFVFILIIVFKTFPKLIKVKLIKIIFTLSPAIFAYVSIWITVGFLEKNKLVSNILNPLLSGRPYYQALYWKSFGVKLFGQRLPDGYVLDNAYINCIIVYGILFFIILMYFYIAKMYKFLKEENPKYALLLFYWIIFAFGESYFLRIGINITLFLLTMNFEKEKKEI